MTRHMPNTTPLAQKVSHEASVTIRYHSAALNTLVASNCDEMSTSLVFSIAICDSARPRISVDTCAAAEQRARRSRVTALVTAAGPPPSHQPAKREQPRA